MCLDIGFQDILHFGQMTFSSGLLVKEIEIDTEFVKKAGCQPALS